MAAIAYVTDEKMIEFHRFNGSHFIVFWRLSKKKFHDFQTGDLLFFLAKDLLTKQSKEKGLMGYGCLKDTKTMSVNHMWEKFGNKTGYNTKNELLDVIKKSNKNEEIPKKITCLILDNVFFFQSPIYLSELGYNINNNLESFTYLDRHEGKLTLDILHQAENIGPDLWINSLDENNDKYFYKQLLRYKLATIMESDDIKLIVDKKYLEKIKADFSAENILWINRYHFCFLKNDNELYIIFYSNKQQFINNFYKLLGQLIILKEGIENNITEEIKIKVLTNRKFTAVQNDILNKYSIEKIYSRE